MSASKIPANKPAAGTPKPLPDAQADDRDDDGEPWRHPPVAPQDENPLKSFARSISETVTGPLADKADKPKA